MDDNAAVSEEGVRAVGCREVEIEVLCLEGGVLVDIFDLAVFTCEVADLAGEGFLGVAFGLFGGVVGVEVGAGGVAVAIGGDGVDVDVVGEGTVFLIWEREEVDVEVDLEGFLVNF